MSACNFLIRIFQDSKIFFFPFYHKCLSRTAKGINMAIRMLRLIQCKLFFQKFLPKSRILKPFCHFFKFYILTELPCPIQVFRNSIPFYQIELIPILIRRMAHKPVRNLFQKEKRFGVSCIFPGIHQSSNQLFILISYDIFPISLLFGGKAVAIPLNTSSPLFQQIKELFLHLSFAGLSVNFSQCPAELSKVE